MKFAARRYLCSLVILLPSLSVCSWAADIAIGSRRELLVDDYLIERLEGRAELRLHSPTVRETAIAHDAPWEGSGSGYHSVFKDGGLYRMYYKAWQLDVSAQGVKTDSHPLFTCYAESRDGIHWVKPELGIVEFAGSKKNNIVIASGTDGTLALDAGHPSIFKDENPACAPDARYKGFVRSSKPNGLVPMKSPDGLHWSPMTTEPVLVKQGAFDSQNLGFWDAEHGVYRAYWRIFTAGTTTEDNWKPGGYRAIRTATSKDFIHWESGTDVRYVDSPTEHLYTSVVKPYFRAPHLFIGFPTRYTDRGATDSLKALPEPENRNWRIKANQRYGTAVTEGLFMSSRDGVLFKRWNEAFLRPGIERPGTWNYGHQYIAWQVVPTKSDLEGAPDELSLYAVESYWTGRSSELRRYTLRMDGFVSASAPMSGGSLVTKPFTFTGKRLSLNFSTSAAGGVRVELQDAAGKTLPGFSAEDCGEIYGDALERTVAWKSKMDVSTLAGKPVRMRFDLKDADVYAFQFTE